VPALTARGIAHARIEDTIDGLPAEALTHAGITPIRSYRIAHSVTEPERERFRRLTRRRRMALRRGRHEGITVGEIRSTAELQQYCALASGPERPGGPYDAGGVVPPLFIRAIFGALAPSRQAVCLLARRHDQPVAGAIFLTSADRMTLFHTVTVSEPELAVSAWDPDLADFQGPTAVTWHAMRVAHARGIPRVDLGVVMPIERRNDPHFLVDHFKRSFGGYLEPMYHGEVTLSRFKHAFQELLPARHDSDDLYVAPLDARRSVPVGAERGPDTSRPAIAPSPVGGKRLA
jgi:Acetyltransferase (GNAT) domain